MVTISRSRFSSVLPCGTERGLVKLIKLIKRDLLSYILSSGLVSYQKQALHSGQLLVRVFITRETWVEYHDVWFGVKGFYILFTVAIFLSLLLGNSLQAQGRCVCGQKRA